MKFGSVRNLAMRFWLQQTHRNRINLDDNYDQSFECSWQLGFKPPDPNNQDHYSIFCSMGDWNSLITDFLEDSRYDMLDLTVNGDHLTLFRNYTKLFLIFSEIMTDFQDVLTVFRAGTLSQPADRRAENITSRVMLEKYAPHGNLQNWFDFINKISKHKTKNIHACNHHIFYCFEDSQTACHSVNLINLLNVRSYMDGQVNYIADTVLVPTLNSALQVILDGYKILDEEFRADPTAFNIFRNLYLGVALQ